MGASDAAASSSSYTVDEALCSAGFGKFQWLVLAYAGMGWVSEAMEMMLLSFVGPSVQIQWGLSSHQESLITSVVFVGELIGSYSWGILSDNHGRRKGFFFTALVTSIAGVLSSISPNYIMLILFRFFVGIGLGGGPVLSSWFLEFVPAPNRGLWMMIFSTFWTFGTIFEASIAWAVMPTFGWRWLLVLSALPSFFLLLFYGMVPESPRYLSTKGYVADAQLILEKLASVNKTALPAGNLVSDLKIELDENPLPSEDTQLISHSKHHNTVAKQMENKMGGIAALYTLLSPQLAISTILLWIVFFGNAFSYYGLVLLTSELSNRNKECEMKALHAKQYGDESLYRNVFITSFAEFPGILISAALVDKVGRKISMASMFFTACILLMPLVVHLNRTLTTVLLFGARICITGSFNIVYIYAPEIYPTSVRATGVGIASSVGRIGGIICPLIAVGLLHSCHQTMAILFFELVMFLSGVAVLLFPFETKGRELTDIVST